MSSPNETPTLFELARAVARADARDLAAWSEPACDGPGCPEDDRPRVTTISHHVSYTWSELDAAQSAGADIMAKKIRAIERDEQARRREQLRRWRRGG